MVINDFNIKGVAVFKTETNTKLRVDANTPLLFSISRELFKLVSRRNTQKINAVSSVNLIQLSSRNCDPRPAKLSRRQSDKQSSSFFVRECLNHDHILTIIVNNAKRYSRILRFKVKERR